MPTGRRDPFMAAIRAVADQRGEGPVAIADSVPYAEELRILQAIAGACSQPIELDDPGPEKHAKAAGAQPDGASTAEARPDGAWTAGARPAGARTGGARTGGTLVSWGPLRVLERVGMGGFGEVYRAFDPILRREVALKLQRTRMPAGRGKRNRTSAKGKAVSTGSDATSWDVRFGGTDNAAFAQHLVEARRLAQVRHPNVLAVYGVEVHDGRAGMWTEYIRGQTLEEQVARRGPFPAEDLFRIGLDLCAALEAVHAAGIIHGDIKTANVMTDGRRTILMDFGAGAAQGTPLAMAPELFEGEAPSVASDVYALGVLLYRLACARYPLSAANWDGLLQLHREAAGRLATPAPPRSASEGSAPARGSSESPAAEQTFVLPVREQRPDLPDPAARIIHRCLAPSRSDRPRLREIDAHLRAAQSNVPIRDFRTSDVQPRDVQNRDVRGGDVRGSDVQTGDVQTSEDVGHPGGERVGGGAVRRYERSRSPDGGPPEERSGSGRHGEEDTRVAGNPPSYDTRLVGRTKELSALRGLFLERRWITLTGSGGNGKTRLAWHAAMEVARQFGDGVYWSGLESLQDPRLLAQTVARSFGLSGSRRQSALDQLIGHLREKECLLVLDGCEHLREAVADLAARLLVEAPHLRILATSREPLLGPPPSEGLPQASRVTASEETQVSAGSRVEEPQELDAREGCLPVPPLGAPGPGGGRREPTLEILEHEGVRLFVDRACRQRPGFLVTPANAAAVARIVERLDGVPLAIELAAARAGSLSMEQIAERLEDGLRLLSAGDTSVPPRHRSLLASIEWSYSLLTEAEQRFLSAVSVFAGGWTLAAAEAICADPAGEAVLDLLDALVRRSLVIFDPGEAPRYRLLESVRAFARDRLNQCDQVIPLREAHLEWFARFAGERSEKLRRPDHEATLREIDREIDNIRLALAWSLERPADMVSAQRGLELCTAMSRYWFLREHYREATAHFAAHLARSSPASAARARCLLASATVLWPLGDVDQALRSATEALELLRTSGDDASSPAALLTIAFLADLKGDHAHARASLEEALAALEARGDVAGMAHAAGNLGTLETRLGRHAEAVPRYERAIELLRELGDEANLAVMGRNLGYSLRWLGELGKARELAEQSVAILRRIGQRRHLAVSLSALADLDLAQDRQEEARVNALEALHLAREAGDRVTLLAVLTVLLEVEYRRRNDATAALLLGAVEAMHQSMGIAIGEGEREAHDARLAELRRRLTEGRCEALRARGRALRPEETMEIAGGAAGPLVE